MDNIFSFGVLLYNQENTVVDTLNSIKWQVITYGNPYKVNLYIIDDASQDKSVSVVKKWIEINKPLFCNYNLYENKKNVGVVKNYNFLLNAIPNKYFKIIAGDDIICKNNIFDQYKSLDDDCLISFYRMDFKNEHIYVKKHYKYYLINFVYKYIHDSGKKISEFNVEKGLYLHTPSTLYTKDLYIRSKASGLNTQFRLFEDDPTWYSIAKNTNCNVIFKRQVHILYRISEHSISNSSNGNSDFEKELLKLHKIYEDNSSGLKKIYWKSRNGRLPNWMKLSYYFDCISFVVKTIDVFLLHKKLYKSFVEWFNLEVDREQKFLDMIISMRETI